MKLLPSLKQKKRYVLFKIISENKFTLSEVKEEVSRALSNYLGQLGISKAGVVFIDEQFDADAQIFLLKVGHKFVDEAKSALALSKSIKNSPIIIKSVRVSGTINKVRGKS
jgi:ribonuclease P/MRP protein subunit POP5